MGCMIVCWLGIPLLACSSDPGGESLHLSMQDDVVLLSWTSHGLQPLIDGMHQFCLSMGLTGSPTKTELAVICRQPLDSELTCIWHVDGKLLPVSPSFKFLGLIFHQSGDMDPAFQRLLQNENGAKASLISMFRHLHCDKSCPMMRRGKWHGIT